MEAAIAVVQDSISLSVGIVGYLRVKHRTTTQSTCSLLKVETVGVVSWYRFAAYSGLGTLLQICRR